MSARLPIAVAVDGSPASDAPLAEALRLAQADNRPLLGVFVLDTGWADYIGNDWQSAAGARQGFLDYIRGQLESQAEAARTQFAAVTRDLPSAHFRVIPGEPLEELCALIARGEAEILVVGPQAFQICGRPSVKTLARDLARRASSLHIV
ncbi:universal stress protein [Sulfuricystis multivorans]|uniref:universal stress protein n=1 Tax=Sulfuricystis multivorans TaxID=2211108 RepID=UPI000F831B8E|nr:universal stress protein [Sulfuricystis multivorans]